MTNKFVASAIECVKLMNRRFLLIKMGVCGVYSCRSHSRNSKESGIHFYKFPKDKQLARKWLSLCRRRDRVNVSTAQICSLHFSDGDFKNLMQHQMMKTKLYLKPNAIPSRNLPSGKRISEEIQATNVLHVQRANRRQERKERTSDSSAKNKGPLKPDERPTLNLSKTNGCKVKSISQLARQRRMERKKNSEFVDSIIKQYDELRKVADSSNGNTNDHHLSLNKCPEENLEKCQNSIINVQDKSGNWRKCNCYMTISTLEEEIIKLKRENSELRKKCQAVHGQFFMSNNNNKSQQDTKMEIVIYAVDP